LNLKVKLFTEWWDSWSEEERGKLTSQLKDSDAKFWASVEGELDGSRKKDVDDFFTVDPISISSSEYLADAPVHSTLNGETTVTVSNGGQDAVQVAVITSETIGTDQENGGEEAGKSVTNIEITGNEKEKKIVPDNLGDSAEIEEQPESEIL